MLGSHPQSPVLDPTYHAQLLAAIDEVSAHAGIPRSFIYKSAKEFCTPQELEWLTKYRAHRARNSGGLCLYGVGDRITARFSALAAALVRNYIHARVVSLSDFLDNEEAMDGTVLFIPNFYVTAEGKPLAAWQIQVVYDHLTKRFLEGKMTVVYVENLETMQKHYGSLVADFIGSEFDLLGA